MKRGLVFGALALSLSALAACGANESDFVARGTLAQLGAEPLSAADQHARFEGCMELRQRHVDAGLWERGGARPLISPNAWLRLDEDEQAQIIDIAGCIARGGQVGQVNVMVLSSVSGAELHFASSENRSDFAGLAE